MEADQKDVAKLLQTTEQQNTKIDKKVRFIDLVPQIVASTLMYFLMVQFGVNMSLSSILIPQLQKESEFMMNNARASELASIWAIATPIGALSSGFLTDKSGRKRAALLT